MLRSGSRMSLTEHLRYDSSIRAFLDRVLPDSPDIPGLSGLAAAATVVPRALATDPTLAGTAIDYRARIALGGLDPYESVAALGIEVLTLHVDDVENGAHRARVLSEAFDLAVRLLEGPSSDDNLNRAALLLAHCEQLYRGGRAVLVGPVGQACDVVADGQGFADGFPSASLADLRSLLAANEPQLAEWRAHIAGAERFEPNPGFVGSILVGGADADWIIGDTLYESKAYQKLTVPLLRGFLRQLLGYVMLDLHDALHVRRVGLWLPRQAQTAMWDLGPLLGGDPDELLPPLREGFQRAADERQLAVHIPATQRRKQQILADSKTTWLAMLWELASSDDHDIRFRVGRNPKSPGALLRELAKDRIARVRSGVASNECVPLDVLETLSRDSRITVRRAAAANPQSPGASGLARELEAGNHARPSVINEDPDNGDVVLASSDRAIVRIAQDRDESAWDSKWFWGFLWMSRGVGLNLTDNVRVPTASLRWASVLGRPTGIPDWLKVGIPLDVKADLMGMERPAHIRRFIADDMPVSDPQIRDRLLADADPEIRWSTLARTLDDPDDALGALLGRLAASRDERIRFRAEGSDEPSWNRRFTRAELDRQTLQLIAAHPSTPLNALRDLRATKFPDVLVALIENPYLPDEDIATLLPRLQTMRSADARESLAASRKIPLAAAEVLTHDRQVRVRAALAGNIDIAESVLTQLADDREPLVLLRVIENPRTPTGLGEFVAEQLLATSTDETLHAVLAAVARRDDIELAEDVEVALDRLSKSRIRDPDLRLMAAGDHRTATRTLKRLAKSADEDVRCAVARNPHAQPETLELLATDPDHSVRAAVAGNGGLSKHSLVALAHDDEAVVRAIAAKSAWLDVDTLRVLLEDDDARVQSAAAENPMLAEQVRARPAPVLTSEMLHEMVAHKYADVRMQVAFSPQAPPDALRLLAGDRRSAHVRRAVAANPNTPVDVLALLVEDKDDQVRQAVAFNGATPPAVLAQLAGQGIDLALVVALNPDAPPEVLDALAQDHEPAVRFAAASARNAREIVGGQASRVRAVGAIGARPGGNRI